jgi:hypothetical protein
MLHRSGWSASELALFPGPNENAPMKKLLTTIMLLSACSSSDNAGESLQGIWYADYAATVRYIFDGNTWEIDEIAPYDVPGPDGGTTIPMGYGLQIESGTFTQSGNTVNFSTTKSSCWGVGSQGSGQFWQKFELGSYGGQPTLRWETDPNLFTREVKQPPAMVGATIGCFDNYYDDFTPHAIQSK